MFDKMVESTNQKGRRRAGGYLVATTLIYGLALVGIAIGTIVGFSPVLAEEYSLEAMLAPPPVPMSPPPPLIHRTAREPQTISFTAPTNPIDLSKIRRAEDLPVRIGHSGPVVIGAPVGVGSGNSPGVWGGPTSTEGAAPPPPPPVVKPSPPPTPEIKPQGSSRVSEGVLQGGAIRRIKPNYPPMARSIRAGGPVQVQVTIAEDGRVTDAIAISGHPMLRSAAVEAARQWLFSPTRLSNVPVKVQGVLTFNFILE